MGALRLVRDVELPGAVGDVVVDARRLVGIAEIEIRLKKMVRTAGNREFSRTSFQGCVHGFGVLPFYGARFVLQMRERGPAISRKRAAMPEQSYQNQNEHQDSN